MGSTLHNDVTGTHARKIWAHLSNGQTITQDEAKSLYGCARLAGRIYDLNNKYGIPSCPAVIAKRIQVTNRDGKAVYIAQYQINPAIQALQAQAAT